MANCKQSGQPSVNTPYRPICIQVTDMDQMGQRVYSLDPNASVLILLRRGKPERFWKIAVIVPAIARPHRVDMFNEAPSYAEQGSRKGFSFSFSFAVCKQTVIAGWPARPRDKAF